MFQEVYLRSNRSVQALKATEILEFLYSYLASHPEELPEEYWIREEPPEKMAADYLAGMTDQFAVRKAEELSPGISNGLFQGVV
jgi:dGTP triphosphohydrolase